MAARREVEQVATVDVGLPGLDASEVELLKACVGFHAKQQVDPGIRERLYQLWCKLDTHHAAERAR